MAGATCGLAWASALRAYMVELAGPTSEVSWSGTIVGILLPGVVTGGLLGWTEHLRRSGAGRVPPWLALAPLPLALGPVLLPGGLVALLTSGLGGGAPAIALLGAAGGFALGGRGPGWGRALGALVALALLVGLVVATPAVGGDELALTEPRGAWVAVLVASLMAVLALACSLPHRRSDVPTGSGAG